MYPIPPGEHLVEERTCKKCSAVFPITDKDMDFYEKVSPSFPSGGVPTTGGGVVAPKRYLIPPPTLCPDCRQQRRLAFRNERKLYKRKCDATGKEIVSIYSPDKPYKVYHQDYWWSDAWDPMSYGREFDFSRKAFEQFRELMQDVPRLGLFVEKTVENGEYSNDTGNCKDIYYCFNGGGGEYLSYCDAFFHTKNCVDCDWVIQGDNSFFSYKCTGISDSSYLFFSKNSHNSSYLYDCDGCNSCTLCIGIINKKYCFQNQQYSKDEYIALVGEFERQPIDERWDIFSRLVKKTPLRGIKNSGCENAIGDGLQDSSNVKSLFDSFNSRNCAYGVNIIGEDMYDVYNCGTPGTLIIDSLASYRIHKSGFIYTSTDISESYYSDSNHGSSNLFLCSGLRRASYCILNKQYTKEEYEELVPKMIEKMMVDGEWGEFFPAWMSPFGYNETVASEYFPLEKDEAQEKGFNWSDYEPPFPQVEKVIDSEGMKRLPDNIRGIPDDILNWALTCEVSGKPFRIIRQELEFYRRHGISVPKKHPDIRHKERMSLRNPRKLYERLCDCPGCEENWGKKGEINTENFGYKDPETSSGGRRKKMITTYAPDRQEKVYCEVCYQKHVF